MNGENKNEKKKVIVQDVTEDKESQETTAQTENDKKEDKGEEAKNEEEKGEEATDTNDLNGDDDGFGLPKSRLKW